MISDSFAIEIPDFALVVLIGVSGSGKSTFAAKHFLPSEVLSSDAFRAFVSDEENDQSATKDAFDALHHVASIRLRRRKTVVVDATNVQPEARKPLLELAREHDCLAVAIVLNVPERVCQDRNRDRADRQFGPHVIVNQSRQMRQSLRNLQREGFRHVFTLNEAQIAGAQVTRVPLWTDLRGERGPFDIVGDVHGCYDELIELLGALGYVPEAGTAVWKHPEQRRLVFLGDLVDRGPKVVETVRLAQAMVGAGAAFCIPGNHDIKLMRALKGNPVTVSHGLAESLRQIEALCEEERAEFKAGFVRFADSLVSHYWLDGGRLCVAHAGLPEAYIGRASRRVREFALYGDTTGENDEFGLPVRYPWADEYRGATTIVYGHTPVPAVEWLNNTVNIDTGCVFGGALTALRWPEREFVQVPARATYAEPARPFRPTHPEPLSEEPSIDPVLIQLVRDMVADHRKNRSLAAEAIAQRNRLQAEVDKEERLLAEMERKAETALEGGHEDLAEQFRREIALHESTREHMQSHLNAATESVEAIKRAVRDQEKRLRSRAAEAGVTVLDADLDVPALPDSSDLEVLEEVDEILNAAVREMKENQIKNRELAIKVITDKNMLQSEVDRLLRAIASADREYTLALEAGDMKRIETLHKERPRLKQSLARMRPELQIAIEAADKVRAQIREEEERIRDRVSKALAIKANMRQIRIEQRIQQARDQFESVTEEIERRWEKVEERLRVRQAQEAARAEVGNVRTEAPGPILSLQWQHDELLRAEDVLGKRLIATRWMNNVIIPAENAAAALEVMSRFAVEPRWLIYLPPTMSPCETAADGDLLERPVEAFAYYRSQGVQEVVCQRKHMGSAAVVVICRDEEAARRRFGATGLDGAPGQCYTRTGRQFFDDPVLHRGLLEEVSGALTRAGFWEEFATDWACLDCELMPWNAKAQGLLREQYAPVGAAAQSALAQAVEVAEAALARGLDLAALRDSLKSRQEDVVGYRAAYARYCWDVGGLDDLRLAPFHLLATEGQVFFDRDHVWHVATLARLAEQSRLFLPTDSRSVATEDEVSQAEGAAWWQEMTEAGGEGMVVKPLSFIARGPKGLIQPAVKVRGREYLRIIYGPEYTEPANLERLRARSLHAKRNLALREFALGVEGLERFVRQEPLRRVHACVFGVLALESEPVDPRL